MRPFGFIEAQGHKAVPIGLDLVSSPFRFGFGGAAIIVIYAKICAFYTFIQTCVA